jgi:hypothetical protein
LETVEAESAVSIVYDCNLAGQTLTFSPTDDQFRMTDAETGTLWNAFSGEALSGELAGQLLERLKSTASFWFGWKDIHPDTLLYGDDA